MKEHISNGVPLAQRLPIEIVRLFILEAAYGVPVTKRFQPVCKRNHEPKCIWGSLSVCRLWRAAALPVYSSSVAVFAASDRRTLCCARNGLSATKAHALGWQHHAVKVLILATSQSLAQGTTLEAISSFEQVFGKTSLARLHLFGRVQQTPATRGQHESNVVDVVPLLGSVGKAFCNLRKVEIEASNLGFQSMTAEPQCATLYENAAIVYKKVVCMDISSCAALMLLDMAMPSLTSLSLDLLCSNVSHCTALVRQQAGILENLQINHIKASDCSAIVLGAHGRLTTYPRLIRLKLDVLGAFSDDNIIETGREMTRLAFTTRMPLFPIIKYVDCGSFYPFADNILWHGAESTLKSLVLAADNVLISWLFPENTSSNASPRPFSKYSRLQNLELRMITRAGVLDTQTQTIHNHIVAAVVDMVQVRRVSICYPNSYTVELKKGGSSTGGFE